MEQDNPDLSRAARLGIPLTRRAKLLAQIFDKSFGIAIAGTSGKSTVAAMVATALRSLGMDPTYYGGASLIDQGIVPCLANAVAGKGKFFCAETDESDGSFLEFHPQISVIHNISKDHKSMEELMGLFTRFAAQTRKTLILNADCPLVRSLSLPPIPAVWYGTDATKFPLIIEEESIEGTRLRWKGSFCKVTQPGMHNVSNALAALSVLEQSDIPLDKAAKALESFKGVRRRLELIGKAGDVWVFDDFAHNPAKIEATLSTLQRFFPRVVTVFQLHGYGPARFMAKDLEELFARMLRPEDFLVLPKIYDAGGTADRSIGAQDIARGILEARNGAPVASVPERHEVVDFVSKTAYGKTAVVVMGARDPSLSDLCRQILTSLSSNGRSRRSPLRR